jgi:hypothetical protein
MRLVDQDVPHPREPRTCRPAVQLIANSGVAQVHPADHGLDPLIPIKQVEQGRIFLIALPSLHRDATVEAGRGHERHEVNRAVVAAQGMLRWSGKFGQRAKLEILL